MGKLIDNGIPGISRRGLLMLTCSMFWIPSVSIFGDSLNSVLTSRSSESVKNVICCIAYFVLIFVQVNVNLKKTI